MTTDRPMGIEVTQAFTAEGDWLQGAHGAIAVAPPKVPLNGESIDQTRARYQGQLSHVADALNAARALLGRIEDNYTLFFGMEDTCQDEFNELSDALTSLAGETV